MRLLFCVSGWLTHYMAMVPTGWAAIAAGHEVRVLCPPSQVDHVSRAGLRPEPLLDGMGIEVHNRMLYYREALDGQWPYPWLPLHPLTGATMRRLADFDLADYHRRVEPEFADRAAGSCDRAASFARQWRPDLVLFDPMSVEGMLAAEAVQVPSALFLWGPIGTDEPPQLRLMPPDLSGSYPRYGLPELSGKLVRHVIDPCPAAIRPPTEAVRLPVRYLPYNGGGALPPWLLAEPGRPRVCLTWSTALTRMSGPRSYLLPALVDALAPLDVELVVTATRQDVAALGPVPGSVRVLENCPLGLLLPSCAAVVHHGGAGSTMTAIGAGVPQLAITFASEQTANARRLAATGAGLTMLGHEADPDRVRSAVQALVTDPEYRRLAGTLQADLLARPVPAQLVGNLSRLAG